MLQGTRFQVQVLKSCKSVQESSEEVLNFKARQISSIEVLKSSFGPILDSCSIDTLYIEIYENQIFSYDFHPICVYMFGLSFLTTLNIYKVYFKGRHK